MKILILLILTPFILLGTNAVYIANAATGGNTGIDCADAKAFSYFNTSGNWSATPTGIQIGPATTIHICGTITGTAGSTALTFQGDGTAGNPITLLFETGALLTNTYWSTSTAAIYGGASRNYIIIDGGTNGTIQNTANGSSPTYPNSQDSGGVYFPICNHCEIKNLNVINLFVKNTNDSQGGGDAIDIHAGSNNSIHDNLIHDTQIGIIMNFGNDTTTQNGDSIYNNTVYHFNHAIAVGDSSTSHTFDGLLVYGNNLYDAVNWDDLVNNDFHHNGVFVFTNNAGNTISNLKIYNNYIHGDMGTTETGHIFLDNEDSGSSTYTGTTIFNNILVDNSPTNGPSNGFIITKDNKSGSVVNIYNNTMYFTTNVGSRCTMNQGASLLFKNNTNYQCGDAIYIPSGTVSASTNNNNYTSVTAINGNSTLAAWRTACSCDAAAFTTALNVNTSTYVPNSGSPLISSALNLTSLSIPALDTGAPAIANIGYGGSCGTGCLARPSSGNWDVGAFPFSSGSPTIPTVTTTSATSVTSSTASSGGTVTSDGGASVTSEGVCWALTANPTTPCTSDGTATPFTSSLTGLSASTLYHYRAFATNSVGTGYGSDLTFTTLAPSSNGGLAKGGNSNFGGKIN